MRITIAVPLALAFAFAFGFGAQASAGDGLERLAPPGPCAEADAALRGEPELGFDPSGGPRAHFDPTDVASGPSSPAAGPPERPAFERTPCDAPTTGCADLLVGREGAGVVREPPPSPGEGPVFGRDVGIAP